MAVAVHCSHGFCGVHSPLRHGDRAFLSPGDSAVLSHSQRNLLILGPSPAAICSELFAVDLQAQPVFIMPLPSLRTWTPECSSSGRPPGLAVTTHLELCSLCPPQDPCLVMPWSRSTASSFKLGSTRSKVAAVPALKMLTPVFIFLLKVCKRKKSGCAGVQGGGLP